MANCYFCAAYVKNGEGYRRKVLVGESARVYFSRRGGGSYGQQYALRTLCYTCAVELDKRNRSLAWKLPITIVMSIVGIIGALRYGANSSNHVETALGSLTFAFFLFGGLGLLTFILLNILESSFREDNKEIENQNTELEQEEQISGVAKKIFESEFLNNGETKEEKRGLKLLFKMITNQSSYEAKSSEWLVNLVLHHANHENVEEAKEFVSLLGRNKSENIDVWFKRVSILAPYELNTEDATVWLTYVYRLALALNIELWFGLNSEEEKEIIEKVSIELNL